MRVVLSHFGLKTLRDAKILSAPIFDEEEGNYVGFIDIIDLTAATLDILEANESFQAQKKKYEEKAKKGEKVDDEEEDEDENQLLSEHLLMDSLSVKAIAGTLFFRFPFLLLARIDSNGSIDFSHRDPFIAVSSDESLLKVAELLREHHRVALTDKEGKVIGEIYRILRPRFLSIFYVLGVATQSGMMEHISEEYFDILEQSGKKVKELHLPHTVYSVTADSTALQALETMKDRV